MNVDLRGFAVWAGTLLGLTPQAATVTGDAEIIVNMATLAGAANFAGLKTWAPSIAPGAAGSGTT